MKKDLSTIEDAALDALLRRRAEEEPFPLPEGYGERLLAACAALDETAPPRRKARRGLYRFTAGVAAALALFIAVPNLSPGAAAAMADLPVIGALAELLTFRTWDYDDGRAHAHVTVPELSGSDAAGAVNDQVRAYTDQLIARFRQECETLPGGYLGLDVTCAVVTDSDSWFTLRIDAVETQAGGRQFCRIFHIDKTTGRPAALADLFPAGADYVAVLSGEVRRQMEDQMAASDEVDYFPEEFQAIDPDQNFYRDDSGRLVLVFDEYAVAPGYMGMPEFTIPGDVTRALMDAPAS